MLRHGIENLNDKVAITGAKGFVGRALHAQLPKAKILDRGSIPSLMDPDSLKTFLDGVEVVFHFAGINAGSGYSPPNELMMANNVLATRNLIEGIRRYSKTKPLLVLLSSIHVYSKKAKLFNEQANVEASSYYGLTKLTQELLVQEAAKGDFLDYVIFRASNIYGQGCRPYYNSAVATFCEKLRKNETLELFGLGTSELDLVYIADVVSILLRAPELTKYKERIFNLSYGLSVTIKEIVDILGGILGTTPKVKLVDTPPIKFIVENKKLLAALGPIEFTDLEIGLQHTFNTLPGAVRYEKELLSERL